MRNELVTDWTIALPEWVRGEAERWRPSGSDEDRMRFVVRLAEENVRRSGGPFAAAIFESATGALVSAGVNDVVRAGNSVLHAEILAIMAAQRRAGSYSLRTEGSPGFALVVSCDPCAMCLGAVLWSGVRRVVCGAFREDAQSLGFDEGPVFPETCRYLEQRGIAILRGVLRDEAAAVLELYRQRGGPVYNG